MQGRSNNPRDDSYEKRRGIATRLELEFAHRRDIISVFVSFHFGLRICGGAIAVDEDRQSSVFLFRWLLAVLVLVFEE